MHEVDEVARIAVREWRRLGVTRPVLRDMTEELKSELLAAFEDDADMTIVTGPDVCSFARAWALERADVRIRPRYGLFVMAAFAGLVLGASVAAGVLALVQFAARVVVDNGAYDVFDSVNGLAILAAYIATGATGYAGALITSRWALSRVHDAHARRSMRALAITLPVAAVIATASAVGFAASTGYDASKKYVAFESLLVLCVLLLALVTARWFGVRAAAARR